MKFKLLSFLITIICSSAVFAQGNDSVEMADTFRSEGKIYVVIAIALLILVGIFVYLLFLDRKINKIQEQIKK